MTHLYLLTNPLLPGFCKIGIAKDVQKRADGLYGPWEIYHSWTVENAAFIEQQIKIKLRRFAAHGFELLNCPVQFVHEEISTFLHADVMEPIPIIKELPIENIFKVTTMKEVGMLMKQSRNQSKLRQQELSTVSNIGVRFIIEAEKGKETCEVGKVLLVLRMLGIKIFLKLP